MERTKTKQTFRRKKTPIPKMKRTSPTSIKMIRKNKPPRMTRGIPNRLQRSVKEGWDILLKLQIRAQKAFYSRNREAIKKIDRQMVPYQRRQAKLLNLRK